MALTHQQSVEIETAFDGFFLPTLRDLGPCNVSRLESALLETMPLPEGAGVGCDARSESVLRWRSLAGDFPLYWLKSAQDEGLIYVQSPPVADGGQSVLYGLSDRGRDRLREIESHWRIFGPGLSLTRPSEVRRIRREYLYYWLYIGKRRRFERALDASDFFRSFQAEKARGGQET